MSAASQPKPDLVHTARCSRQVRWRVHADDAGEGSKCRRRLLWSPGLYSFLTLCLKHVLDILLVLTEIDLFHRRFWGRATLLDFGPVVALPPLCRRTWCRTRTSCRAALLLWRLGEARQVDVAIRQACWTLLLARGGHIAPYRDNWRSPNKGTGFYAVFEWVRVLVLRFDRVEDAVEKVGGLGRGRGVEGVVKVRLVGGIGRLLVRARLRLRLRVCLSARV
jgi:hypothetical protein